MQTRNAKVIWEWATNSLLVTVVHLNIHPPKLPFLWTDPQTQVRYLPNPWTNLTYRPKPHPYPISNFATVHWIDRQTDRPTDGWREYSMTIGHFHFIESDDAA